MASLSILGRFRPRIGRFCTLCSSQYNVQRWQNCALSLSSQIYEQKKDIPQEVPRNEGKFRKQKYSNPVERTFGILADDVRNYFTRRKYDFQEILENVKDSARVENTHRSDQSISRPVEEVWPSFCDVLVIGGGAVGSSIAYHLKEAARDGLNVVVVEEDTTYKRASTVLSVGGIRQQFSVPENIQLSMYGMEFLRKSPELLAVEGFDTPNMQFNPNGYLTLASEKGYQQLWENYELQRDLGAKVIFLSGRELSQKYPWLNTDDIAAGVMGLENEGWFDPWSLLISLQRKSIALGTHLINGRVTKLTVDTVDDMILEGKAQSNLRRLLSAEVTLPGGETRTINFAIAVVAAGAWTGEIGRMLGLGQGPGILGVPIPIEPRKRYVYCVHAPNGPGLDSPLVIDPNGTYFRREGLGGLYLCGQSPIEANEPQVDNLDVDYEYFDNEVWPSIARRVPAFENLKLHSSWAGYYDYNKFDQNGIIGLHPLFSNMFITSGFSGHGIQQAPGVGRAVMECIIHGDYRTINLERFGFGRILAKVPLYEQNIV